MQNTVSHISEDRRIHFWRRIRYDSADSTGRRSSNLPIVTDLLRGTVGNFAGLLIRALPNGYGRRDVVSLRVAASSGILIRDYRAAAEPLAVSSQFTILSLTRLGRQAPAFLV